MKARELLALVGLFVPLGVVGIDTFPAKELVEIAARHHLPMPPRNARLVLAHTTMRAVLGNESTSRDPGIYSPAFLLEQRADGSILILRGIERQILAGRHDQDPHWRPFSDVPQQPRLGGYVTEFDRLSAFVCAVQLAARGDQAAAQSVWQRVKASRWFVDGDPREDVAAELNNLPLLLGRCIFEHLKNRLVDEPQKWSDTRACMQALFDDFPALKEDARRRLVFDGLSVALSAPMPAPDSTEALLINWSRTPRTTRNDLDSVRQLDPAEEPDRKLILRGADAVPGLIALLNDRRITTHGLEGFGGFGNANSWILLLGELARDLLGQITGIYGHWSPWEEADTTELRSWLDKCRKVGEEKMLVESVFKRENGKITYVNETPTRILAHKYPQKLPPLCEEFSKDAKPQTVPYALTEAVVNARLPKEMKVGVLAGFARRGSLEQQQAVLQCLARLEPKECAKILLPIIRKLPADSTGPYCGCPEAGITHCVMQIEDGEIWREYLEAAKRSSVGLRMEMMNPMDYSYIGQTNRSRRLAFLAAFLKDENVRERPNGGRHSKFSGPCAAFKFEKIAVRDFAALKIASILDLPDAPDEFWTAAQWEALRNQVQRKLAQEKLPKF